MIIATFAWVLLVLGFLARKKRSRHIPLMHSAIILDVGLVLYLQVTRDAVQTAMEFSLSLPEQIHILFSTLALVLYFPVLYLGWAVVRGKSGARSKHRKLALVTFVCRTLGFLFMFSMWQSPAS